MVSHKTNHSAHRGGSRVAVVIVIVLLVVLGSLTFRYNNGNVKTSNTGVRGGAYDDIAAYENPGKDRNKRLVVSNILDEFAYGEVGSTKESAAKVVWRKRNDRWTRIDLTQTSWSCKALMDNKVPPHLFGTQEQVNGCVFYDLDDCKKYEDECTNHDILNGTFQYPEIYREHYGGY